MNQLSWLIYWADAAPKLSTFVCITTFFLFIAAMVLTILYFVAASQKRRVDEYDTAVADWRIADTATRGKQPDRYDDRFDFSSDAREWAAWVPNLRVFPFLAPLFFILWGGSFLVPSKDTFYLIAASQAGEQAIKTPEFLKVRNVLNKWLDDQTASPHDDDKKNDDTSK